MLKKRDLYEVPQLYELMAHPEVLPFIRHKAFSTDELYFQTKQMMEQEERGLLISRTILNEYQHPIGTINLFDIQDNKGFLATWIGQPYFGKGYNKHAKEQFLEELFLISGIEAVFIKIRNNNLRSLKAALKLPYMIAARPLYPETYNAVNQESPVYELFVISKEQYFLYKQLTGATGDGEAVV
ncbi:GNAT family N-acetyltransferase [Sediminibacillus albus]|uniref:Protein N-acetyltransferase, RimJ/RimL family n=1 Tax=Sediminibacillus albus TaxID=407036 RepID=A0A1G9B3T8_9BACI|nr:GNAT family N-acetyltransferase [Sediminibacillus albus]SDK34201.1 Protein N-acetyltransferase, RimJ/RimL family [Sediminibacillus albus]